jgi:hypothetical protein
MDSLGIKYDGKKMEHCKDQGPKRPGGEKHVKYSSKSIDRGKCTYRKTQ